MESIASHKESVIHLWDSLCDNCSLWFIQLVYRAFKKSVEHIQEREGK